MDILQKMLEMDPDRRITARQALDHPYFQECRAKDLSFANPKVREQKVNVLDLIDSVAKVLPAARRLAQQAVPRGGLQEQPRTLETQIQSNPGPRLEAERRGERDPGLHCENLLQHQQWPLRHDGAYQNPRLIDERPDAVGLLERRVRLG